jgi:ribosome maturation factor RimP
MCDEKSGMNPLFCLCIAGKREAREVAKETTVQVAERLIEGVLEELGLRLWDVRFEKEGGDWYLRYLIDRPEGVTIGDLESVNKAIDKILDREDPIAQHYVLEVSSPGAERQFTRDWHYEENIGCLVRVRLIRPVEGIREFVGELSGHDGQNVTILLGDEDEATEMTFAKKEAAFVKLYVDFESGGYEG